MFALAPRAQVQWPSHASLPLVHGGLYIIYAPPPMSELAPQDPQQRRRLRASAVSSYPPLSASATTARRWPVSAPRSPVVNGGATPDVRASGARHITSRSPPGSNADVPGLSSSRSRVSGATYSAALIVILLRRQPTAALQLPAVLDPQVCNQPRIEMRLICQSAARRGGGCAAEKSAAKTARFPGPARLLPVARPRPSGVSQHRPQPAATHTTLQLPVGPALPIVLDRVHCRPASRLYIILHLHKSMLLASTRYRNRCALSVYADPVPHSAPPASRSTQKRRDWAHHDSAATSDMPTTSQVRAALAASPSPSSAVVGPAYESVPLSAVAWYLRAPFETASKNLGGVVARAATAFPASVKGGVNVHAGKDSAGESGKETGAGAKHGEKRNVTEKEKAEADAWAGGEADDEADEALSLPGSSGATNATFTADPTRRSRRAGLSGAQRGRILRALAYSVAELQTFHCERMRKMPLRELDPSMLLGFPCRDEAKWVDLRRRIGETINNKILAGAGSEHNVRDTGWLRWGYTARTGIEYDQYDTGIEEGFGAEEARERRCDTSAYGAGPGGWPLGLGLEIQRWRLRCNHDIRTQLKSGWGAVAARGAADENTTRLAAVAMQLRTPEKSAWGREASDVVDRRRTTREQRTRTPPRSVSGHTATASWSVGRDVGGTGPFLGLGADGATSLAGAARAHQPADSRAASGTRHGARAAAMRKPLDGAGTGSARRARGLRSGVGSHLYKRAAGPYAGLRLSRGDGQLSETAEGGDIRMRWQWSREGGCIRYGGVKDGGRMRGGGARERQLRGTLEIGGDDQIAAAQRPLISSSAADQMILAAARRLIKYFPLPMSGR
ncbi:hypothetical protein B0H15DRAFT_802732 [Mycena belliarum]|uniref:Cysteine protease n=1 Tax=Mycena belliarum TaxID=1033014 RepID=A0AAD6XNM4_9AGAR|nr:hypothetical protein B0H15DRAFT_802732 [Mycena belliae]